MKSLIKSSFFLILLMAIINIGVTNAYNEEPKATKTIINTNEPSSVQLKKIIKCNVNSAMPIFNSLDIDNLNILYSNLVCYRCVFVVYPDGSIKESHCYVVICNDTLA